MYLTCIGRIQKGMVVFGPATLGFGPTFGPELIFLDLQRVDLNLDLDWLYVCRYALIEFGSAVLGIGPSLVYLICIGWIQNGICVIGGVIELGE